MYEHFKNAFLTAIAHIVDISQIKMISKALDKTAKDFEFTEKCTDLIPYGVGEPELVKTYIVSKKIEGLSEKTLYNYRTHLRLFFETVRKPPEKIATNDIRIYLYQYQKEKGITNRSLDKIRQCIRSFYEWAVDNEYIDKNPARLLNQIKYTAKPRQSLSQMDLEHVRRSCESEKDTAIIEMLYSTGCRVSELIGIKFTDIDFDTKKVHLFGKGGKYRDSFINAKAEIALQEYLKVRKGNSEYLFVSDRKPYNQIKKEAVEKIVRRISDKSGIEMTPHILRHTTATTAMRNGMPVESIQAMLGHSKIDTTMIYAKADIGAVQQQHIRCVI